MNPRYLLCPGNVKSRADGDIHFITAGQLASLYKLNPSEYLVLPDADDLSKRNERAYLWARVDACELIELGPRSSGDYTLVKRTVNTVINKGITMTSQDLNLEALIQSKNLPAPRVTAEDFNANIKHVEYVRYVSVTGQVLRWCVITTASGYAVTGDPSCAASSENDNQEVGEFIALGNAKRNMWPLMGYELKQRLADAGSLS